MSAAIQTGLPTKVTGPVLVGIITYVLLVGGFVGWAFLAPLNSAVLGQAILVVETSRRDIQHLEGGIIREIHVRDGAEVQPGDRLITLDPTRALAGLQIIRGQMDANLVQIARLRAEMNAAPQMELDPEIRRRAETEQDLQDVITGQQQIFTARRASLQGQVDVLRQRIAQIESQIIGQEAQERARIRQIGFIQEELNGVNELLRGGFAPRTRALALNRELARLQGEQGEYLSTVARSRQQIGEAQLQILQIERSFQEEVARALQEAQNLLREQQERLVANQDIVRHLEIRAPVAGTVVGLNVFTDGGVIAPGRTLMQLVPHGDNLIIEAQIAAQDIEVVHEGQQAVIRFPALPQRTLPMLTGHVLHVSADRFTDERTGMAYFKIRVAPDATSLAKIAERRLVAGMPAEVTIATGQRTVASYLVEPLTDAMRKAMRER
ncbi:HlyD family type I secretion periplasmic adaptor subunit [Roseococcus sp. SDR]|uniref:HlyD family type I secretion periplasmic adaptor subunit n=1 Tax=Roseococcus sp. SDR TaxID=2835532 RepID=UPI001BD15B36|nr:HlyD family type I secretion periplasmic adaptor subunit [Roseococcus sp. SDR]MBV1848328.1 HlyD family type I secretion periplasmic adaptor subunit [Roseococcus sp. SDR]